MVNQPEVINNEAKPMKKNHPALISNIRNPQKISACIQPDLVSFKIFVWKKAIRIVFHNLVTGSLNLLSAVTCPKTLHLGHKTKKNRVTASTMKKPKTKGCKS